MKIQNFRHSFAIFVEALDHVRLIFEVVTASVMTGLIIWFEFDFHAEYLKQSIC